MFRFVSPLSSSHHASKRKVPGKGGLRYFKNIGLGFKTPREASQGAFRLLCELTSICLTRGALPPAHFPGRAGHRAAPAGTDARRQLGSDVPRVFIRSKWINASYIWRVEAFATCASRTQALTSTRSARSLGTCPSAAVFSLVSIAKQVVQLNWLSLRTGDVQKNPTTTPDARRHREVR